MVFLHRPLASIAPPRPLEKETFCHCPSLKSICIAASVEFIDRHCFIAHSLGYWSNSGLETVTFEAGSHLLEIAVRTFAGCFSLKHICVPASVQKMNADSFPDYLFSVIGFERGNPYFAIEGDFVLEFTDHDLITYTMTKSEVAIPDEISMIGQSSFVHCTSIRSVIFGDHRVCH
jgi:hypothetical protein